MTTEIDAEGLSWPERLTLRDTKVYADEGQRIFTTATGHGYARQEYVRADLATTRTSEAEPVACADCGAKDPFMYPCHQQGCPHSPTPVSDDQVEAVRDVLAERKRQVDVEHWMPGHDDQHTGGELAQAAAAYAYYGTEAENSQPPAESIFPTTWDMSWWKPGDHRRNLVKAGALIIAEIERLDRLAAMGSTKR